MYSVLGDDNSGHEKAKGLNKNVVASIRHNKYKDVLLNQKCLCHSMNNKLKVKILEQGLIMNLTKFLYSALMIKYISLTMQWI